jgi:sulfide:quinone oxidoreductase
MSAPRPLSVLIAGGGVAGLEATLALRELAGELVDVTVLAPSGEFRYRPLTVTEPFSAAVQLAFRLDEIVGQAGARLRTGALASVDPERREARTTDGETIGYDVLLVATGAKAQEGVAGAVTFWGGGGGFGALLEELRSGAARQPVFAVPSGSSWPLPLYELALLTAAELGLHGSDTPVTLVTPESRPLEVFGAEASDAVAEVLASGGVRFVPRSHAVAVVGGDLALAPRGSLPADAVVTMPALTGPAIVGLPHDRHGFLPADDGGVVHEVASVFAAGDVTTFPVKQGGIAAQQADAAAQQISVLAGARVKLEPFRPVLRGRLLTGGAPLFLRAELHGGRGETSEASTEALWWPPAKIFGRYLGPFLAARAGDPTPV